MNGTRRFFLFNVIFFLQISSACSLCNMPTAWVGSWYQRGMNSLLAITNDSFQTKGLCRDVLPSRQYYLFEDHSNHCTRCLLFIQRHINLLQYRESECSDADNLSTASSCSDMIAPDAELYTLHRDGSKPQLCPIQAPFILTNYVKDGTVCGKSIPSSFIGECVNDQQFRLHLAPCPTSHHQSLDLQCICVGTWIDDFYTYFVARIHSHTTKRHHTENQYACFRFLTKQKGISNSFSLRMATDDSCRDLNSKYMGTEMTLLPSNHSTINEPSISCVFPNELQQREWYSLNGTIRMIISNSDMELIDVGEQTTNISRRFHCVKQITTMIYRIRSFTNCHVIEKCLRIIRRTENVLELITDHDKTCTNLNNDDFTLTLFTKSFAISDSSSSLCPTHIGHITLESSLDVKDKSLQISIGCDTERKLTVLTRERDIEHRSITKSDTCLASWQSADSTTTYIIGQSTRSNATYCLSFHLTDPIVIRNDSNGCSFNNVDGDDDDASLAMYSARSIRPCSRSQQMSASSSLTFLLLMTIMLFSLHNVR